MNAIKKKHRTADGEIYYWVQKAEEDAPWLVFLPGLTVDHTLFDRQMEWFSGRWNCLTWDAPGHGRSRPFALNYSLQDKARFLHDILEAERITAPILVGQSMGGYVSQAYMDLYPNSVSGFVSVDSCPISRKYYTSWELALLKKTKGMYMCIPWKLVLKWSIEGTAVTEYGRELMRKTWAVYEKEEYCSLAGHGFRILAEAVEARPEYLITCPVLLLCGEKDQVGYMKRYNHQWTKQDGYPLVWLKDAGHNSNTDVPEEVNRLIEGFVREIKGI